MALPDGSAPFLLIPKSWTFGVFGDLTQTGAIIMSSGPGDASRLYETSDGCYSCHLLFTNPDFTGFWDAIAFHDKNGGLHWIRENSAVLTAYPKGEGVFAASNSALVIRPNKKILFGTGGPGGPRTFASDLENMGQWTAVNAPLQGKSEAAGIFSLAFRDHEHGIGVGGDYKHPENRDGAAAFTSDGGVSWRAAAVPPGGYRSSVGWDQHRQAWIAVGSTGSDISRDDGNTWYRLDGIAWNALSIPWAIGSGGRIARLDLALDPVRLSPLFK